MSYRRAVIVVACLLAVLALCSSFDFAPGASTNMTAPAAAPGGGSTDTLTERYDAWVRAHEARGGDRAVTLRLNRIAALCDESLPAAERPVAGTVTFDLVDGRVQAQLAAPADAPAFGLWLVDNRPGSGRSVAPEPGDRFVFVGSFDVGRTLDAAVPALRDGFVVDAVVVAPADAHPTDSVALVALPTLFQRIYTAERTGRSLTPDAHESTAAHASSSPFGPSVAHAKKRRTQRELLVASIDDMVLTGAELFINETFNGNGRTCATCHPPLNNFTLDASFIASLPDHDPLFVAEFVPELAENFEKPRLMRKLGLILENTNGFGDLENSFTMRSVPHTLALMTSITPAAGGADGSTTPPDHRLGWSGDGSAGTGTLREFAIGAVVQHATRSTDRVPGVDFRFPTDAELDAMEAFQLSLGRAADPDISAMSMRSPIAERGRVLYLRTDSNEGAAGKCQLCHANGGATVGFIPGGLNFNFDTGVADLPDRPADLIDTLNNPDDDGFGNPGNDTFNTPTVIEAADTAPYFHDNSVATLEGAIAFYNSDAFANSAAGGLLESLDTGGVGIDLETTDVDAIGAFVRVLNALENIRSADATLVMVGSKGSRHLVDYARAEIEDAHQVLTAVHLHPRAVHDLRQAERMLDGKLDNRKINRIRDLLEQARAMLVF